MEEDWDLHAVVRGCSSVSVHVCVSTSTASSQEHPFSSSGLFQDLSNPGGGGECFVEDLHEFCRPFLPKPHDPNRTGLNPGAPPTQIQKRVPQQHSIPKSSSSHAPSPRSKRRKCHFKEECLVSAENLPSDKWSWRKYGQKPIKGSPYPRGYYRCSTSKGCTARKQVEKNRSDPGMFIVTYTGEHNHPKPASLNTVSRKPAAEVSKSEDSSKQSLSRETSPAVQAMDDGVSKMDLDDDFFMGLEDLTPPKPSDTGHSHLPLELRLRLDCLTPPPFHRQ